MENLFFKRILARTLAGASDGEMGESIEELSSIEDAEIGDSTDAAVIVKIATKLGLGDLEEAVAADNDLAKHALYADKVHRAHTMLVEPPSPLLSQPQPHRPSTPPGPPPPSPPKPKPIDARTAARNAYLAANRLLTEEQRRVLLTQLPSRVDLEAQFGEPLSDDDVRAQGIVPKADAIVLVAELLAEAQSFPSGLPVPPDVQAVLQMGIAGDHVEFGSFAELPEFAAAERTQNYAGVCEVLRSLVASVHMQAHDAERIPESEDDNDVEFPDWYESQHGIELGDRVSPLSLPPAAQRDEDAATLPLEYSDDEEDLVPVPPYEYGQDNGSSGSSGESE